MSDAPPIRPEQVAGKIYGAVVFSDIQNIPRQR